MFRVGQACLLVVAFGVAVQILMVPVVTARPNYLENFKADKFRKAGVDGCGTCHVDPAGGGVRNPFGLAYAANDHEFTPLMRAEWPDRFDVKKTTPADGITFYFSDPANQFVVAEVADKKYLVNLRDGGYVAPAAPAAVAAAASLDKKRKSNFSFFVASAGLGKGGNLGGLLGADRQCQVLAEAAGAGDSLWRAYLSTSYNGRPAVNAGDRIGTGPWYNKKGILIARGVAELHSGNNNLNAQTALTEKGAIPSGLELLTGTLPTGTAAVDANCDNWMSSGAESAQLGQVGRAGNKSRSCSQDDLRATGADVSFSCFAVGPKPPEPISTGPAVPVRGPAVQAFTDDDGEVFVNTNCSTCHNLDRVKGKKGTADEWQQTVFRMKDKGLNITDDDVFSLIDYLAAKYK